MVKSADEKAEKSQERSTQAARRAEQVVRAAEVRAQQAKDRATDAKIRGEQTSRVAIERAEQSEDWATQAIRAVEQRVQHSDKAHIGFPLLLNPLPNKGPQPRNDTK
jgi:hypothetical protein